MVEIPGAHARRLGDAGDAGAMKTLVDEAGDGGVQDLPTPKLAAILRVRRGRLGLGHCRVLSHGRGPRWPREQGLVQR